MRLGRPPSRSTVSGAHSERVGANRRHRYSWGTSCTLQTYLGIGGFVSAKAGWTARSAGLQALTGLLHGR